jgi:glycosyltransferase involved in cell wall biosynthesis
MIATDAWHPQVNGVVNTYVNVHRHAAEAGMEMVFVTPEQYRTVPLPTYPEIRLALVRRAHIARAVDAHKPDAIHIATEGPIGLAARRYCVANKLKFTTSYHTRFPEYIAARAPIPLSWSYAFERWFHNASSGVMVATASLQAELAAHGIKNPIIWSRGVDTTLFRPRPGDRFGVARPVFLYVGRVAVEKNIEAFLSLDLPGTKAVIGGGPLLDALRVKYPQALFLGPKFGDELAEYFAAADVFVFPSVTDTFGNVLLEALASGVPVAAYPVTGPKDIVTPDVGCLNTDLREAALCALGVNREACRAYAEQFSWEACAHHFAHNIRQIEWPDLTEPAGELALAQA